MMRDMQDFLTALRYLTALFLITLAGRFAAVSAARFFSAAAEPRQERERDPARLGSETTHPTLALNEADETRRRRLKELEEEMSKEAEGGPDREERALRLRRVVVDWGPERSEVFIGGKKVGHTPFGGQISCIDGQPVEIVVLPTRGVPLQRRLQCSGEQLRVQNDPERDGEVDAAHP